jgi:hypothetical protein
MLRPGRDDDDNDDDDDDDDDDDVGVQGVPRGLPVSDVSI